MLASLSVPLPSKIASCAYIGLVPLSLGRTLRARRMRWVRPGFFAVQAGEVFFFLIALNFFSASPGIPGAFGAAKDVAIPLSSPRLFSAAK